jgi:hypothetical protein
MTQPGADVRETKLLRELSRIAWMKVDADPFGNHTLEIDAPPPDNIIFLTVRAGLHDLRKLSQLFPQEARLGTFRPVVDEALRPRSVEAMNPVAQRLVPCRRSSPSLPGPFHLEPQARDRTRRLWLTCFDRRACVRNLEAERNWIECCAPSSEGRRPTDQALSERLNQGKMARETGLEPATSGVTGRRSNQLSYSPTRARADKPDVFPSQGS